MFTHAYMSSKVTCLTEEAYKCQEKANVIKTEVYLLQYNTIRNYILIIYELSNFDYLPGVVSQTRVSGGNRNHEPHTNILAHYLLDYRGTQCALICVLYMSEGSYSLKQTLNDRFLSSFLWHDYFTIRVFARNLLRASRRRNILLYFVQLEMPNQGFESSQYTTCWTTVTSDRLTGSRRRNFKVDSEWQIFEKLSLNFLKIFLYL